jgi:1-acyl-sn-glycerol-3-phosphate acyltransferase
MSDEEAKTKAGAEEILPEQSLDALIVELNELVKRLQALTPNYAPPAYAPRRLLASIEEKLTKCTPEVRRDLLQRVQSALGDDLFDPETWKGLWYLLNYTLELQADMIRRRFTGEYETDPWSLDWELVETVLPLLNFLYTSYWRVEVTGIENIPYKGRTLMVSNHSGQLPWDAAMIVAAVWNEHPSQRLVRSLFDPWFATLPFLSAIYVKLGHAVASVENGIRLLQKEDLVAVFPEGHAGMGKLYKDRYQLTRFGRGGFAKMALSTGAPIVPVSVVGAEETYVSLAKSSTMARLTGVPYFPITPTFPWLGPLGLIPLPTKWYIDFGAPIATHAYDPNAATDLLGLSQLQDQVRDTVQRMIDSRLAQRNSVFLG